MRRSNLIYPTTYGNYLVDDKDFTSRIGRNHANSSCIYSPRNRNTNKSSVCSLTAGFRFSKLTIKHQNASCAGMIWKD